MPRVRPAVAAALTATAALLAAAPTARAGSVTVSAPYAFDLAPEAGGGDVAALIGPAVAYAGSQAVSLPGFDDMGGARTLAEAELRLAMTIAGAVSVYDAPPLATRNPMRPAVHLIPMANGRPPAPRHPNPTPLGAAVYMTGIQVGLGGEAEAVPLLASADFGPPLMLPVESVFINETAEGADTATTGLDALTGPGDVPVDVSARVLLAYLDGISTGAANGLTAEGTVSLTYRYDAPPPPPEIPTPPAAAGGLMLVLLGLARARRRWRSRAL